MVALEIKLMNISCRSDVYVIFREWTNNFDRSIKAIFLNGILLDSDFNILSLRIPISYHDTFSFCLWFKALDVICSILLFCLFGWFFVLRILQLILWRLLIKVAKLNSRQINTFYWFIFFIVINTLKCFIVNDNLQRNEQISIKLQQSHIFHRW